jgi:hypothetical protein
MKLSPGPKPSASPASSAPACGHETQARHYRGVRSTHEAGETIHVTVNGDPLDPRRDLADYSSLGLFDWGCTTCYAAQLAVAILADALEDDELALNSHADFLDQVIAHLPWPEFALSTSEVFEWIGRPGQELASSA